MERATHLLWAAAGSPDPRKPIVHGTGVCYWCGRRIDGACCRVRQAMGANFAEHDAAVAPSSDIVCHGCTWCFSGRPPDTLRLWSVLYRADKPALPSHPKAPDLGPNIHLQNKADPVEFRSVLRQPPATGRWVCSIADTGQAHVVPFAHVNVGPRPWRVRWERTEVIGDAATFARLDNACAALYTSGFNKRAIAEGSPSATSLNQIGVDLWRTHDAVIDPWRGSALLGLVMFLLRKGCL